MQKTLGKITVKYVCTKQCAISIKPNVICFVYLLQKCIMYVGDPFYGTSET